MAWAAADAHEGHGTDLNTQPDPYMQTTAVDIGMSLQMLVACSEGGGTLIAVYGDQITPAEGQQRQISCRSTR